MTYKNQSQFLLFKAADGTVHVNIRLKGEDIWLTQAVMVINDYLEIVQ